MKIITEEEKRKVINLYFKENKTMLSISEELNISRITVSDIINEYKKIHKIDKNTGKVNFRKSGNYQKPYVYIPNQFLNAIGITEAEREVEILLNQENKEITLKKSKK